MYMPGRGAIYTVREPHNPSRALIRDQVTASKVMRVSDIVYDICPHHTERLP